MAQVTTMILAHPLAAIWLVSACGLWLAIYATTRTRSEAARERRRG